MAEVQEGPVVGAQMPSSASEKESQWLQAPQFTTSAGAVFQPAHDLQSPLRNHPNQRLTVKVLPQPRATRQLLQLAHYKVPWQLGCRFILTPPNSTPSPP